MESLALAVGHKEVLELLSTSCSQLKFLLRVTLCEAGRQHMIELIEFTDQISARLELLQAQLQDSRHCDSCHVIICAISSDVSAYS